MTNFDTKWARTPLLPQLWIGITRPCFIRFWRSTKPNWLARRKESNDIKKAKLYLKCCGFAPWPPSSCWYISWPLPPTHSSKSIPPYDEDKTCNHFWYKLCFSKSWMIDSTSSIIHRTCNSFHLSSRFCL